MRKCRGDPWKGRQQAAFRCRASEDVDLSLPSLDAVSLFFLPQFWGEVEHAGMEVLEEEVFEKKTAEILKRVAKACSVGAQVTLIVGGGALLFRYVNTISVSLGGRPPVANICSN